MVSIKEATGLSFHYLENLLKEKRGKLLYDEAKIDRYTSYSKNSLIYYIMVKIMNSSSGTPGIVFFFQTVYL